MHRTAAQLVFLLAGCGRLQFDPAATTDGGTDPDATADAHPCVPVGHDEDADGFDDACDACPQRADNQSDGDGDFVGDACDLAATHQVRTMFDPFIAPRTEWSFTNAVFIGDAAQFNSPGGGAGASLMGTAGRETFELVGVVIDGGTLARQVSLGIGPPAPDPGAYYCELYDDGSGHALQLTYTFDSMTYQNVDTIDLPTRLDSGPFRIILDHTPPTTTCIADWGGSRFMVGGAIPVLSPLQFYFSVFQISAEAHSFVRLATP